MLFRSCLTWSGEADPSREWRGGTEDAGCGGGGDVEEGGRTWLSSLHRRAPCASPLSGVLQHGGGNQTELP